MIRTYAEIFSGKVPEDFGISKTKGSSLTIPGQGSDLAAIIQSIVKLPPLDERTFDVGSGADPDIRALQIKTDLDALYQAEGVNLAEDAKARQKARKEAKDADDADKEKRSADADKE